VPEGISQYLLSGTIPAGLNLEINPERAFKGGEAFTNTFLKLNFVKMNAV
jgi:hypothetical protein